MHYYNAKKIEAHLFRCVFNETDSSSEIKKVGNQSFGATVAKLFGKPTFLFGQPQN